MNSEKSYRDTWEDHLKDNHFPTYVRSVREISFESFRDIVLNDESKSRKLITDFLSGDVFIVKGVLDRSVAKKIRQDVYSYGQSTPEQDLRADSPIPNFHCTSLQSTTKDGYNEHAHSYYFWRWNPDELKVFERIDHYWNIIKIFNGLGKHGLKENLPEHKVIDRVQILRYPINIGKITTHCDVARWQKTNVAISLTEVGLDYESGGLYCLDSDENEVTIESRVKTGDSILWLPSIFHGVDEPKVKDSVDPRSSEGRWQLLAQAIQSWCVEDRVVSISYGNFKKNPDKVREDYLFKGGL